MPFKKVKEDIVELMKKDNLPDFVIKNFIRLYEATLKNEAGHIREFCIKPVIDLKEYENIKQYENIGKENIGKIILGKLNGGLGTSMGLDKAKNLLEVKKGFNFFDVFRMQIDRFKEFEDIDIPLVLMNSFNTNKDTLEYFENYDDVNIHSFLQFKHPKIYKDSLHPVKEMDEKFIWNPPGHGDFFAALHDCKLLDHFLDEGYEYIFVSNGDNLGAVIDYSILGFIISNNIDFLMEVVKRTPSDKKGGHLVLRKSDNKLVLRESAQVHSDDKEHSENIVKHSFFNSNNLWINLKSVKKILEENNNCLNLPLIRNEKNINPQNLKSEKVFQLETGIGCAIELFPNSEALVISKERFAPVKKCSDLLALWSDIYIFNKHSQLVISPKRSLSPIVIELDDVYFKMFNDFNSRFSVVPSLIDCTSFSIKGDFLFNKNVKFVGDVKLVNNTSKQVVLDKDFYKDEEVIFE
ncbi:UTP--glucose-1-phosphate uridylyltransferase [Candidatus Woesearchaeota archaeon]|nr:UTP--glucose-1-phosphate uridylyltransferase [Candidatus Woesearchaeota archaeon]MCF8013650.1 UTP--glucose-1-phosphate uridylyltransferase [Candidatus Woesearchaeota archaeon]